MKLEVSERQLRSIITMKDDMTAMLGCAEDDSHWIKCIKDVENMLDYNNIDKKTGKRITPHNK